MPELDLEMANPIINHRVEEISSNLKLARDLSLNYSNDYLIKDWLSSTALSVVYGDSNCGKSFFALDIATHIASGSLWMGNKVLHGKVLYLASEGGKSFTKRIEAIKLNQSELYERMASNLMLLPIQIDLHASGDVDAICTSLEGRSFALIIVDTLAMSFGDGNESDTGDMGKFIKNITALKEHFECHILVVHHTGKDQSKGARGSTSLRAAVDTEIEVKASKHIRVATTRKQRDHENGKNVAFSLTGVNVGLDQDGDPITSCVVKPEDKNLQGLSKNHHLTGNAKIAEQALQDAFAKHGHRIYDAENYPQNRDVVNVDYWRKSYLRMRAESAIKTDSLKKDFSRQVSLFENQDIIRSFDDNVWRVNEADRQDK